MGKSTPSGNTTVTQNSSPWSGQQPYLSNLYSQAQSLDQHNPLSFYPGETIAPTQPQTVQGLNLIQQRALSGSPVTNAADASAINTLSGNFLSAGNPYFANMIGQVGQAIQPQIDSQFEANGRYGSGADANAFASSLANTAGGLAYQNYNQGLNNMTQTAFLAPQLAANDYTDLNNLLGVGSSVQGIGQNYLNEAQQRYAYNQQAPYQQAQLYQSLLGNPLGGSSTTTQPYFTNPIGSAVGLGLGGLGIASGLNGLGLFGSGTAAGIGSTASVASASPALEAALLGL